MDNNEPIKNSGSKGSVKKIEEELNYLVEYDINNPKVYELLKQLASIFIYQNKYMYGYHDVQEVCHDVASDIYIKLLHGTRINAWIYYIGTCIRRSYVPNQRKVEHEVINTDGDPTLKQAVISMCTGSSKSIITNMDQIQRSMFLDNMDGLLRKTLSATKFKLKSPEWLSLYTNVSINLYKTLENNKKFEFVYLRLEEYLKPYVQIIINQFYKEFLSSNFMESIMDSIFDDQEMSLVCDDSAVKEYYERWKS